MTFSYRTPHLLFRLPLALTVLLALLAWNPAQTALAQRTFDVNSVGDAGDANPGDGVCATSSGVCTFRAALEEAAADPTSDVITFENIPTVGGTAVIRTRQNVLSVGGYVVSGDRGEAGAIHIRGNTAPGWTPGGPPVVILEGSQVTGSQWPFTSHGLHLYGRGLDGSSIAAIGIINFPADGLRLTEVADVDVIGCTIGVDADGVTPRPNGHSGIGLIRAENTDIIGLGAFTNVISGNGSHGIFISEGRASNIQGARIGVSADGTAAVGNSGYGVYILNSTGNRISGSLGDVETIVSGNAGGGIYIEGGGPDARDGNVVTNTFVGTDVTGTRALPNGNGVGILLTGRNNVIGPDKLGKDSNVLSGNDDVGILVGTGGSDAALARENVIRNNYVGTTADGSAALSNVVGIRVDYGMSNEISGNVLSGNKREGVFIRGASTLNDVKGNYVGVGLPSDPRAAYVDLGNGSDGIRVEATEAGAATSNIVQRNYVGYNDDGIDVTTAYTRIQSNYVGADRNAKQFGNTSDGIVVKGDNVEVSGNVIGDNAEQGIYVYGGSGALIKGNFIGSDGQRAFPNRDAGIKITSTSKAATGNRIGTSSPDDANLIGSNGTGVLILKGAAAAHGNTIGINRIYGNGFDVDLGGDGRTANDFGDSDEGPNRLINFPEFESAITRYDALSGKVNIRYKVDCNTTSCAYPLTVWFYALNVSGRDADGAPVYLGKDTYPASSASAFRNISLTPPGSGVVDEGDLLVASVTDADGNSSEHSDQQSLGAGGVAIEDPADLPDEVTLYPNVPNPFSDRTSIRYLLPEPTHVRLSIYDVTGRRIAVLVEGSQSAGMQTVELGPKESLPSGVYFFYLEAGDTVEVGRMTVLR